MDSLVETFLKSPHEEDRKKAIGALARTADREAVIALQQLAEIDESLEIRFYARKALSMIKSMRRTKSDDPLLMLIPEKLDEETFLSLSDEEKCALLKALIGQNRSDTLQCLISLLKIEQNPYVLATLVIAIGTFGSVAECRFLIPCLAHRDARVRANTIEALELIGNLKLFAYIFPLLEDPDNRVRANAARSLKSIEPFTSFRLLQAMITSGKVAFQASAIYVLRCFESDASAALIAPFLASPREELRARAEQTLRLLAEKGIARAVELVENIQQPQTLPDYMPDLEPEAEQGQGLGAESLLADVTGHPDPEHDIYYRLRQAFIMPDPRQRLEEIEKESVHLGEKAVEPLMEFLAQESDPMVVGKIYILLGRLYDARAVPCLLQGLDNPDNRCRANAVEAIGMLGDPESLNYLIPFLEDSHNRVRGNAILALRAADGVDIKVAIMSLVEHSEEFYQRTAVYVLAQLQRPESFPILKRMTRAPYPVVRKNAHTAINALIKAGFNLNNEMADAPGAGSPEPEFADQIINMIGSAPGGRIQPVTRQRTQGFVPVKKVATGWPGWKIASAVALLLVLFSGLAVAVNAYLKFSAEQAARAVAVDAAVTMARPAIQQGRQVLENVPLLLEEAEKVRVAVARDTAAAVAAQKKLNRMREAVVRASSLAQELVAAFADFKNTHGIVSRHCQQLIQIVKQVRQAPAGQNYPYTGNVDSDKIKSDLVSLAAIREEFNRSASLISKLPVALGHTRANLPEKNDLLSQQKPLKKLSEVLPMFEKPAADMDAFAKNILIKVSEIEKAETALIKANPRHEMFEEISTVKDSLYESRNKLQKVQETIAAERQEAEKMLAGADVASLINELESAAKGLDFASKTVDLLVELPDMMQQSMGSVVRLMSILQQKVFAETVRVGMEADFTTKWDSIISKERSQIAGLFSSAHPTQRITAEGVASFEKIDLADISDELQAASVLLASCKSCFSHAEVIIENIVTEKPAVSD